MERSRWLTDRQQQAWRQLIALVIQLPAALEHQLQRDAGISHFEYWVMALLSEAPDRALRLSHLASQSSGSLSRLSHLVTRLESHGWVGRQRCDDDARATLAVLTDSGYDKVVASAPGHVDTVRSIVFEGLDDDDVEDLARLCRTILARLDEVARTPPLPAGDGR